MCHCCGEMEKSLTLNCQFHADEYACPDVLIKYTEVFDEYGLIIHDGGSSTITIQFCPFCGTKLPDSKREMWFEALEKMGFSEPTDQDIPESFKDKSWYDNKK